MTKRNVFEEVLLEKQWKSPLQNGRDWGHGPVINLLGGINSWREDISMLFSQHANHPGGWRVETLQCISILVLL